MANRIIVLIDMDCFYAQVEQKLFPEIQGKPCAVVQYKKWKGGGIIAVNYEARAAGVTRNMFGDDAKMLCPEIHLARVPESRGKADLTRYRDASKDVFTVLTQFSEFVERASIDEAYIDLTSEVQKMVRDSTNVKAEDLPSTHVVDGFENENLNNEDSRNGFVKWLNEIYDEIEPNILDQQLAIAAKLVEDIRAAVYKETNFHCSAGIAHNKMLAKLACGLNKPKKQTIVPQSSVPGLFANLSLKKIRNLGGKLGDSLIDTLNCKTMGDLSKISHKQLRNHFGDKTGCWLYDLGRGIENEPVNPRQLAKSIGCSKNFSGKSALKKTEEVKYWIDQLAAEVVERLSHDLQANKRIAKVLTVTIRSAGSSESLDNLTRSCPIHVYDAHRIASDVMMLLNKLNNGTKGDWSPCIYCLGISAGKFQDHIENMANIKSFFTNGNEKTGNSSATKTTVEKRVKIIEKQHENDEIGERNGENIRNNFGKKNKVNIKSFFSQRKPKSENSEGDRIEFEQNNEKTVEILDKKIDNSKPSDGIPEKPLEVVEKITEIPEETERDLEKPGKSNETPTKGFFASKMEEFKRKSIENQDKNEENWALPGVREIGKITANLASEKCGMKRFLDSPNKNIKNNKIPENFFLCDDCGEIISVWDSIEHSDYHVAIQLQSEFRNERNSQNVVRKTPTKPNIKTKGIKRKINNEKESKEKKTNEKVRKIEMFFQRT